MTTAATGRVHRLDARPSRIESRLQKKKNLLCSWLERSCVTLRASQQDPLLAKVGGERKRWVEGGGVEGAEY